LLERLNVRLLRTPSRDVRSIDYDEDERGIRPATGACAMADSHAAQPPRDRDVARAGS
jgi:hypothetical protein